MNGFTSSPPKSNIGSCKICLCMNIQYKEDGLKCVASCIPLGAKIATFPKNKLESQMATNKTLW
jgi:hypothetical protein